MEEEKNPKDADLQKMCINTEWGGLGDDGSLDDIVTPYDTEVDQNSINSGKQRLETLYQCGLLSCVCFRISALFMYVCAHLYMLFLKTVSIMLWYAQVFILQYK